CSQAPARPLYLKTPALRPADASAIEQSPNRLITKHRLVDTAPPAINSRRLGQNDAVDRLATPNHDRPRLFLIRTLSVGITAGFFQADRCGDRLRPASLLLQSYYRTRPHKRR